MWQLQTDSENIAVFQEQGSPWHLRCNLARPDDGITVRQHASETNVSPTVRLVPPLKQLSELPEPGVAAGVFPPLDETYFRGPDAIACLPQDDEHPFGLTTTYRILSINSTSLTIETILSIQTWLLDAAPVLDLCVQAPFRSIQSDTSMNRAENTVSPSRQSGLSRCPAPITSIDSGAVPMAISFPPADRFAATQMETSGEGMHVRLLGEFLEKGVIRKARFWTSYGSVAACEEDLQTHYRYLLKQPLPLTP